jgi:Leucine-rich repeat (LRR) protein
MKLFIGILLNLFLTKLAFSEVMEMKCDEIKGISYYERYYGSKCTISDVSGDSSSTFVIRSANNFEYNKIIQEVEFKTSKLYDIPREIFGTFQMLKKVQANACGLEDLHKSNFNYASALQELRMRSNKIKKLPSSVFSTIETLTTLDLSANEIDEIAKTAFADLQSLEYLTLSDNKLVSIDESIFKDLTALISLRLDSNKLQIIEENLFENNLNLTEIRLDTNEIAIINGQPFTKLSKLRYLNVGSNRLHTIDIVNTGLERLWIPYNKLKTLDVNKNLKLLYAPYNELEEINFTGNTELMELKLRQNSISSIANFSSLVKLEIFDISYNPIDTLQISSFSRMNDLVKLNLENTNIKKDSITFGTFAHNANLTHLDISYNQLIEIDFSIFTSLVQLTHLKIDGNNLTEIPYENIKVNFPRLSLISLVDNDWNCTYLTTMIKQLRTMNVIVYVFSKLRVYDEMNVDGIRCHNNKTDHVYWKKPVMHRDDNEANDSFENPPPVPSSPIMFLRANLTKIWNKISELQVSFSRINEEQKIAKSFLINNQPLVAREPIGDSHNLIVQSEFGFIKVILCLMFSVMMLFAIVAIIKFAKQQRFYYPSESLRRSTATIQTTMEHVM